MALSDGSSMAEWGAFFDTPLQSTVIKHPHGSKGTSAQPTRMLENSMHLYMGPTREVGPGKPLRQCLWSLSSGCGSWAPGPENWGGDTHDPDLLVTAAPMAMGSRSRGTRDPAPLVQSCLWLQPLSPHLQQWSPQTYMHSPVHNIGAQVTLAAPTHVPSPVVWSLWKGGGSQALPKTHHPCAVGNNPSDPGSSEAATTPKPKTQ